MEINDKNSLLALIELAVKDKNFANKEVLKVIREATEYFILREGEILSHKYLFLFNTFQNIEIEPHKKISQHIKFFKDYYEKGSIEEKFILNNFLFGLEILNGNFKEGLKEFLIRSFSFHSHSAYSNDEYRFTHTFIKDYLIASPEWFVEIVREIIKNFFKYDKVAQRSFFVHFASVLWNNKIMNTNKIWLTLFDDLVELLNICIAQNLIDEQMYMHFFTYHIYGNNIQTIDEWRIFSERVEKPASLCYQEWGRKHLLPQPKKRVSSKKKKIAFLIDRIVINSPWMVIYSLWKALLENEEFNKNYEIYVYSMNYLDKQLDNEELVAKIKSLGIKFYSPQNEFSDYGFYYPHLEKALRIREKIIEDKIDYLIGGFGYDISNFIFSNRSAPKQIFWSHGNCTSEIENIDIRISHFHQECEEYDWKIFNVPISEEFLVGFEKEKENGLLIKREMLKEFGEDTIFLGTIGRLVKIESENYLKTLSEIMKQNPNTVYLACGDGNFENVKKLMQKVGIDLNRVIFTGQVNPHIFGWIIDVWLDTFPLLQGNSRNEFEAKGGAVVGIEKYYPEVFVKSLKSVTEKKLLAKDEKEYIEFANRVIQNENYRKEVGEFFKKRMELVNQFDLEDFIKVLN